MFSIIVAVDLNNCIGLNNKLLWHLSNDLKRFRKITRGKTVIMGYNTYESLPIKPLPKRKNIVIIDGNFDIGGDVITVHSISEALFLCKNEEETFIIGGESIFEQMLPAVDKIYLTRVYHEFECDKYFPELEPYEWQLESSERHSKDEKHLYDYSFEIYTRV